MRMMIAWATEIKVPESALPMTIESLDMGRQLVFFLLSAFLEPISKLFEQDAN